MSTLALPQVETIGARGPRRGRVSPWKAWGLLLLVPYVVIFCVFVAYPVGYSIRHLPEIRRAVQAAGYEVGFTNASGVNYLWRTIDPFDIRRLAMERELSMSMFRAQLALPPLGYAVDDRDHQDMG